MAVFCLTEYRRRFSLFVLMNLGSFQFEVTAKEKLSISLLGIYTTRGSHLEMFRHSKKHFCFR